MNYLTTAEALKQGMQVPTQPTREDYQRFYSEREEWEQFGKIELRHYLTKEGSYHYTALIYVIDGLELVPNAWYNKKTFEFFLHKFKESNKTFKKEAPSRVGKPSAKKITAWVEYLKEYKNFHETIKNASNNKREESIKEINSISPNVKWSVSGNTASLDTENVFIDFELLSNGSYQARVHVRNTKLETIKKLAKL